MHRLSRLHRVLYRTRPEETVFAVASSSATLSEMTTTTTTVLRCYGAMLSLDSSPCTCGGVRIEPASLPVKRRSFVLDKVENDATRQTSRNIVSRFRSRNGGRVPINESPACARLSLFLSPSPSYREKKIDQYLKLA